MQRKNLNMQWLTICSLHPQVIHCQCAVGSLYLRVLPWKGTNIASPD